MLRINSTTTRAVTAFDVVGLFCILLKCRPTASCRSCGAHIIIRYVFTVNQKRCISSKKTNKKNSRASFHPRGRCLTKCKGTTPCALILPITLTLSSIFFHTFAPFRTTLSHRSAQLLYSRHVNMAGTTRDMAEKWWQILPD